MINDDKYRYERKFIIDNNNKNLVKLFIRNHPLNFKESFPSRRVNNIYLDTQNKQSYDDNIEGLSDRSKVRVRWYGLDRYKLNLPKLEIKVKKGTVGKKITYSLNNFSISKDFSKKFLINLISNSDISHEYFSFIKSYNLSLMNYYDREYFVSRDQNFRITLDTNVNYLSIKNKKNSFSEKYKKNFEMIMELKYFEQFDKFSSQITNLFPYRLSKNSKYIEGIIELNKFI